MSESNKPIHPRKLEIVHAAVTCFLERGYHQTGVRDIAKQADVSLGNLYNHFKGKQAVLAFIAEMEGEELSEFIGLLAECTRPLAALEQFIHEYAAYASHPENALLGVEFLSEAMRNPVIDDAFGKNRSRLIDALVSCLAAGANSGVFVSYADDPTVACIILDMIEGHGLRSLSKSNGTKTATQVLNDLILNSLKS